MQYSQVSKSHVFDHQSNKLVKLPSLSGVVVETPWWLWPGSLDEVTLSIKGNAHHAVEAAKLNNLVIASQFNSNPYSEYPNKIYSEPTSQAWIYPVIKFKDVKTGEVVQITVDTIAAVSGNDMLHPMGSGANAFYPAIVAGIMYNLVTSQGARRYSTSFPNSLNAFASIDGLKNLAMFRDELISNAYIFNFGLPSKKFTVMYQGKPLEGKCYAYMLGTFAILLRDDFSFDSLAALSGCADGNLVVDKFMFSTNAVIQSLMGWG